MEVHVYGHDRCQANLSMGWLVCACITIFHEVTTIFFWQYSVGQLENILVDVSWHRVVHTKCFELQYFKKKRKKEHCYQDFNHRCKGGYILGKTPVSLPITTGYSLPPTWDRFWQKKRQSNGEWHFDRAKLHELASDPIHSWSTAADSCPPSDFSDRPPISISMTTGRKWLTWNRSIGRMTAIGYRPATGCNIYKVWFSALADIDCTKSASSRALNRCML